MKNIIIKIGEKMEDDIRKVFEHPERITAKPGTHTIYLKNTGELSRLLSPKKLELVSYVIHGGKNKTIGEIAKKLKRKQEAVSRDANQLALAGMLTKKKQSQKTLLNSDYDSLQIILGKSD
ncbi:MAG: hypothetical protein NUV67_04010 [archaeon]|nr:hypothetical protein [archaeon]